jgi:hypothetical protein
MQYTGYFTTWSNRSGHYTDTNKRRLYSDLLAISRGYLHNPTDRAHLYITDSTGKTIKSAYIYQSHTQLT